MGSQLRIVAIATLIALVALPFAISAPQGQGSAKTAKQGSGETRKQGDKKKGNKGIGGTKVSGKQRITKSTNGFPDGITPSDVYARMDLLDRCLDALLKHRNKKIKESEFPSEIESALEPMHVYQTVLICTWRLQLFDDQLGVKHIPTISSDPREYHPRDVHFIVEMMLANVRTIGANLSVPLPDRLDPFEDKDPTDVFNRAVKVFVKLNSLCGITTLEPKEVFSQMARGVEDVKSMLQQQDVACRYNIRPLPTPDDREPADVFKVCLDIRKQINRMRPAFDLKPIPIPQTPPTRIRPRDVFFQTQIIIAELNLLKLPLKTESSSPLPIPVSSDTTPTHVQRQASLILHLLKQVKLPNSTLSTASE